MLATRHTRAYVEETRPRAVLLVGSAAEGLSDTNSDLDMIIYHDELPSTHQLEAVRRQIAALDTTAVGPKVENYVVAGVECQVGHFRVADLEQEMTEVLEGPEAASLFQKALMGLTEGCPRRPCRSHRGTLHG